MPAPIRPVDEHGFPIPTKFEDWPRGSEDEPRPPRRSVFQRIGRWKWLLLLLVPGLLFGRQLVDLGRDIVAGFQLHRAEENLDAGNLPKALAHANRAIDWEPNPARRAAALLLRAQIRTEMQNLDGSIRDCDEAIALLNDDKPLRKSSLVAAKIYGLRGWVNERLAHHREALDDCKAALEYCPPGSPDEHANLLNTRAYVCALSGTELETGLQDIEQAMREVGENNCEYLDTRAYLHFRLGKYEVALQEMQAAIRVMDQQRMGLQFDWNPEFIRGRPVDEYALAREKKLIEQNLAVMYHHRGEIYQKLAETHKDKDTADFKKSSDADFRRAVEYGFDPKNGVL